VLKQALYMSAVLLLLSACSWSQFKFWGLSRATNCTDAVEHEQRLGSHFVRVEVAETTKTSHLRREYLTGTLEDVPVEIVLECIEVGEGDGMNTIAPPEGSAPCVE
jgi:hypothetical protein